MQVHGPGRNSQVRADAHACVIHRQRADARRPQSAEKLVQLTETPAAPDGRSSPLKTALPAAQARKTDAALVRLALSVLAASERGQPDHRGEVLQRCEAVEGELPPSLVEASI